MKFARFTVILALALAGLPDAGAHGPKRVPEPSGASEPALQGARLYRGMNERQIPLARIRAVLRGATDVLVPSHRFTTIKTAGSLEDAEVAERIDADLGYWRARGELHQLALCHADPYECLMPSEESLRAVSMSEASGWLLPEALFPVRDYGGKQSALKYFDPVISTSVSREVAREFARPFTDGSGRVFKGYVLELRDHHGRHCPIERQGAGRCLVQTGEYGEEREYPFFGYVRSDEIVAVEVDGVRWVRAPGGR